MTEKLSGQDSDKHFITAQKLGSGVLILGDPAQLEQVDYPERTAEEESQLPELARLAYEARKAFDEQKNS